MFSEGLIDNIRDNYNELSSLDVAIDGQALKGTLHNLLTPYLAHRNTIDNNNRLISFYTREGSKQQKLLPFYIGISNYFKIYNDIKQELSTETFDTSTLENMLSKTLKLFPSEFSYIGKKWKVLELNVDLTKNNKILFYIESIERIPLIRAPKIQDLIGTNSNNKDFDIEQIYIAVNELQENVNDFIVKNKKFFEFDKLSDNSSSKLNIKDLIELGSKVNVKPNSGVLLFTSKTKYLQLVKDTTFNDYGISNMFPIAEVKVSRDMEISIEENLDVDNVPIIYYCSSDYYFSWETILEELKLTHVNTIVIDDFDVLMKKEARTDYHYFRDFSDEIIEAQNNNVIKDVYFLQKDYSLEVDKVMKDNGLNSYPWLMNHKERSMLKGMTSSNESNFKVLPIHNNFAYKFWENFRFISRHLTEEVINEEGINLKAEYLKLIKTGYELNERIGSYCNPATIAKEIEAFVVDLKLIENNMNSSSFSNKIEKIEESLIYQDFGHSKINTVVGKIKKEGVSSNVLIVSKNKNESDQRFASNYVLNQTGSSADFLHIDELSFEKTKDYEHVFFFVFTGRLTKSIFFDSYGEFQSVVLNSKMELSYFEYCFNRYTPIIKDLSDFDNKLLLLNLEDQEYLVDSNKIEFNLSDYIVNSYTKIEDKPQVKIENNEEEETIDEDEDEEDELGTSEFDFTFVINKLIESDSNPESKHSLQDSQGYNTLIYFEDGFIRVSESKYFYILNEDIGGKSDDLKKQTSELVAGDRIFLMSGFNDDFTELLDYLKDRYSKLEKHFDAANSWRKDLQLKYLELDGYITSLQRYLKSNGIPVTPPTVDRWVNGKTIYPDSLIELITLFKTQENSFSNEYEIDEIINATAWLAKFRTKLHKQIYLYHIYKTYGMLHQIKELDLKDLIESLNDVVEIKEILMIQRN